MKRVVYFDDGLNNNKYIFQEKIGKCSLYQRRTPSGYYSHQDWGIGFGDDKFLMIPSYNNYCKEEVLDIIDEYNENGKFGLMVQQGGNFYRLHNSGKVEI